MLEIDSRSRVCKLEGLNQKVAFESWMFNERKAAPESIIPGLALKVIHISEQCLSSIDGFPSYAREQESLD